MIFFLQVFGKGNAFSGSIEALRKRRFWTLWLRSTRNCFGEEMMSLRMRDGLQPHLAKILLSDENIAPSLGHFAKVLTDKMPTATFELARAFCALLLETWASESKVIKEKVTADPAYLRGEEGAVKLDALLDDQRRQESVKCAVTLCLERRVSFVKVLFAVSLLPICDERNASYPEFSSSEAHLQNFHRIHPAYKIASWLVSMLQQADGLGKLREAQRAELFAQFAEVRTCFACCVSAS